MNKAISAATIKSYKNKQKITMLTAYDYTSALIADRAGLDMVLVGDSLGMVMLGRSDTLSVTLDEMLVHTKAVAAGLKNALLVADMPFMSYETGCSDALKNAAKLMAKGGARAVKLEGMYTEQVKALTKAGIPVMGHLGLTPQRIAELGGFKVQAKTAEVAEKLLKDCLALEDAGCFSIVLECIPAPVAEIISAKLKIPTIGIGAGPACDGQVLVLHDVLGLFDTFRPKFVKRYAELGSLFQKAIEDYCSEVRAGTFPSAEHCFEIDSAELEKIKKSKK